MGIDIWEVVDAAKTKPYGFQAFYPGPGVGGHCIPLDPFYLTWKAKEYDYHMKLIEASGAINDYMPEKLTLQRLKLFFPFTPSPNGSLFNGLATISTACKCSYRTPSLQVQALLQWTWLYWTMVIILKP